MPNTILVVEDEKVLQETLVYKLKHQGYQVEAVSDGQAAVETARRIKPDLLILDLMLPKLDGFEVTRILRKEMNMPILMLTARDEEIDRVLQDELGDRRLGIEGYAESRWIVLDYGNVVVHLFDDEARSYYDLENLWAEAKRIDLTATLAGIR